MEELFHQMGFVGFCKFPLCPFSCVGAVNIQIGKVENRDAIKPVLRSLVKAV